MPVWAVDSVSNRAVAERHWQLRGSADAHQGITLFKVDDERDAESNCLRVIDDVDLHHGIYSSGSEVSVLKVIGTQASERVQQDLKAYGFVKFEVTPEGFNAQAS
jgi:hypothetical protein